MNSKQDALTPADSHQRREPTFGTPPVIEVALGVAFEPLEALNTARIGDLWARAWKSAYPEIRERPPVASEDDPNKVQPGLRLWFLNATETALIQVQRDRFVRNWQKRIDHPDEIYPRYWAKDGVRDTFSAEFEQFFDFVTDEGIGDLRVRSYEVTYVNQIPAVGWDRHGEVDKILSPWSGEFSDRFLGELEDVALLTRHAIIDNGVKRGRLLVSLQPGFSKKPTKQPVYRLSLAAKVSPTSDKHDMVSILQSLDLCHHWVVRGFESFTTPHMHAIWEKE